MSGQVQAIKDRRVSQATCEKFGVTSIMGQDGAVMNHWYPYYTQDTKELKATKKRICATKDFPWTGDLARVGLFGQQACSGRGKYITIVEGECDALAVSEMFDRKWDVVSLRNGAGNALRDIKGDPNDLDYAPGSLEFLEGYDNIVLCFDSDAAGQKAVEEVRDLFTPNKLKIVKLPMKDAGAMLCDGKVREFTKAWWDAEAYTPAGIVTIDQTWDEVYKYTQTPSVPYPWTGLNNLLMGQRKKEINIWAADTGVGKSQAMREIQHHLIQTTDARVGCLMMEESVAKTTLGWMSFHANRRLHKEMQYLSEEELKGYWEAAQIGNRLILLDHKGWQNNLDTLKARIRHMVHSMGCEYIVLDHLHYVLSSIAGATGDWSGIDELMTDLSGLVNELDICMHLVSHISEGRNLRGSKGISKLADAVIYLERDKHAEDLTIKHTTTVVVDKDRWGGETGIACYLYYDPATGRMTECQKPDEAGTNSEF
jgi:twinkle protein